MDWNFNIGLQSCNKRVGIRGEMMPDMSLIQRESAPMSSIILAFFYIIINVENRTAEFFSFSVREYEIAPEYVFVLFNSLE